MQVSRSPIARCTSTAATDESTPPESPQITRWPGGTSCRMRSISVSMKCPGVQSGRAAADLEQEVVEDLAAARRVRHLRMELDGEERLGVVLHRRDRRVVAGRGHLEARRWRVHVVAVAHPYRRLLAHPEPLEEPPALDLDGRPSVLAPVRALHSSAGELRHHLHSVAESQHRRAHARAERRRRSGRPRRRPSWVRPTG